MHILGNKIVYKENSKVSLITYNDSALDIFEEEIPKKSLTLFIKYRGGLTDFDSPL